MATGDTYAQQSDGRGERSDDNDKEKNDEPKNTTISPDHQTPGGVQARNHTVPTLRPRGSTHTSQ